MKLKTLQFGKAMRAALFVLLLSVAGMTKALAQTFTVGNLNYSLNDDGVSVTVTGHVDGQSATGELVIPESVELYGTTYPVTVIGESAFYYCTGFTGSLTIPNTVTRIGHYAFGNCAFTGALVIPENVTYIGLNAFLDCTGFTTLNYNAIDCDIYGDWIEFCTSLTTLNIGENVQRIPYGFLSGCSSFIGSLTIPESVTFISENAFNGCGGFTGSLDIPDATTTIGTNAFSGCTSLSGTLTLGQSLTEIGNSAFFGACEGFTSFDVKPETPPTLGTNVFTSANYGIPVQVPCGSLDAYQNADGWSLFTNIQEPNPCMWEISATANPSSGGTVSGAGIYEQGQTCTLTATPAEGYEFLNWKEGDAVVSTEATYSFTVEGHRNLVANFVLEGLCSIVFNLYDSYGDGWNNNKLVVSATDGTYQELTINSGNYATYTLDILDGSHITLTWIEGSYIDECSFNIQYASNGYPIYQGTNLNGTSYEFDLNCEEAFTPFMITAVPNLAEGGTVSGAGEYVIGEVCTLTATPNEDYIFVKWTENGAEVSTESTYSFTVEGNRNLVANFRYLGYDIWVSIQPAEGGIVNDGTLSGGCLHYDNGSYYTNIGTGGTIYWGVMFPADMITETNLSRVDLYENDNNTEPITVYIYSGGTNAPGTLLYSETVYPVGGDAFHEIIFASPVTIDPSQNLWVVFSEYGSQPANACNDTGNANGRWVSTDGIEWADLANYGGGCTWMIRAYVGYPIGSYLEGETCILTATPNEGYEFNKWTENGTVVSTDAEYSFTVTSSRELVARFRSFNAIAFADPNVEAICVNHWDTDGDGFLSYDEAAAVTNLGQVFYYHSEITSFDELQYFTGLTQINNRDFYNCSNLTSIILPEGITSIGSYAFCYCSSLTGDLVIPNSVTDIQDNAFYGCDGFNGSLTIGANVNYMGYGAFGYAGFTTVNYNAINCSSLEGWLWNPETITTLNIGENVEVIPYGAFSYFSNLTGDLVIPNSVTSIGDDAFSGCSSLTSVALGNSLTSIGYSAFNSCSGLTSIVIPNSVTEIGSWAFGNCSSLTSASLPEGMTSINEGVFGECPSLTSVVFPSALETIGHYAFQSCGLTSLELPNTVTSIGIGAFSNCTSISGTLDLPASVTTIGEEAFYNCTGLHSIIMSEDIHSIGSRAFKNCSGLRGELTLPELLESVGGEAFYGCDGISTVNYNAINCHYMGSAGTPVFYDCAFTRLNIGENVTTIPDFAFKRCFMLTEMYVGAVVPPTLFSSTFGMVSRSIPVSVPYGTGDTYRNAPYWEEFFNIIDDYTPTQYAYHWNFDIHDYEYNMTVVGVIHINGVEQETNTLEIGAFCGDECRGRQMLAYHPIADRYVVFLMIYGNPDDLITFRLYDHATGEESTMNCANSITFEADASFGTLTSPYVFNFGNTMQTSTFSPGWNWWSTYLETQGYNSLAMLEEALESNAQQIKSQSDFAQYLEIPGYGGYWYGTLDTILSNEQSYKVQISSACQIVLNGTPVSPADHPITIQPGWNWIGFPSSSAISFADAFAGFTPTDGDQVKSQSSFTQYMEIPGYGGIWYGGLEAENLTPGMGLMYKSMDSSTATLVYPNAGRSVENVVSIEKHWTNDIHAYSSNMTLMAVVELDDVELTSDRYELAAFANGECRGSARLTYVEPLDRYLAFLTIAGDEAADLTFALYNHTTGEESFESNDVIVYTTDASAGSFNAPMVVRFRGTTGLDDLESQVQVFPNPVKQGERIHVGMEAETMGTVRIDIVNALGTVVASTTSNVIPASITAPAIPGVYMLRIAVDDQEICMRKLVVE